MTTKEILENLYDDSSFKKWFKANAKKLTRDINNFFDKFKGKVITVESARPLLSWSVVVPKEFKMFLYNTLAKLNGQAVLASYGLKGSDFNKVLRNALKENNDIEASDEVKAYLKMNYKEFYKALFDALKNYETLGTKSSEPIARIITMKLGSEKGRTVKFCEELKIYLVKLLKNVIDSINNDMKNYETPINASSVSVEETLRNILDEVTKKAYRIAPNVTKEFSANEFNIYGCLKLIYGLTEFQACFDWSKEGINVKLIKCENGVFHDIISNSISIYDLEELKDELLNYLDLVEKEFNSNKVLIEEKPNKVREINYSDLIDICKIILNGNYDNDLKAKANLYLSLSTAKDINTNFMTTLADSIMAGYKNANGIEDSFNEVLTEVKNYLKSKFNCSNFSKREINGREALVCVKDDINLIFRLGYVDGKNTIVCNACGNDVDYCSYTVAVTDLSSTLTDLECWVKPILSNVVESAAQVKISPKPIKDLLNELGLEGTIHKDAKGQSFMISKIKGTNINANLGSYFVLNLFYRTKTNTVDVQTENDKGQYIYCRNISTIEELRKVLEKSVVEIKNRNH